MMMNTSDYLEVTVGIEPFSPENAEIVEAMVADLPYDSFVIGDKDVKCYIQKDLYDRRALRLVLSDLPFTTTIMAVPVPFRNWNAEWESGFKPIVVDGTVTVKQADDESCRPTRYNIKLRPEMAFGTGHHDTTRMMLSSMLEYQENIRGKVVMDMGCGTAVLAILAAKMGASKVYGLDIDAVAAHSAWLNARLNRVGRRVETYCGDANSCTVQPAMPIFARPSTRTERKIFCTFRRLFFNLLPFFRSSSNASSRSAFPNLPTGGCCRCDRCTQPCQ